jgi:hypothetical protein
METHLLVGTEEVRAASHTIARAAQEMQHAAASMETSLDRHRQFLDDWLQRFTAALEEPRVTHP